MNPLASIKLNINAAGGEGLHLKQEVETLTLKLEAKEQAEAADGGGEEAQLTIDKLNGQLAAQSSASEQLHAENTLLSAQNASAAAGGGGGGGGDAATAQAEAAKLREEMVAAQARRRRTRNRVRRY